MVGVVLRGSITMRRMGEMLEGATRRTGGLEWRRLGRGGGGRGEGVGGGAGDGGDCLYGRGVEAAGRWAW
jgi:hypothetical protein